MKIAALGLLLSTTAMVVIGIVMLFSTGSFSPDAYKKKKLPIATQTNIHKSQTAAVSTDLENSVVKQGESEILWDPASLVRRQAVWLAIGLAVCALAALVDYNFWRKTWPYWFAIAVVLLAACFAFPKLNGARRWIRFAGFSMQPSEIGKIAIVAFLAWWCEKYEACTKEFWKGVLAPLLCVAVIMGLVAREVDLGTTTVMALTAFTMIFVAGARPLHLAPFPLMGLAGLAYAAYKIPQRLRRVMAFLDLEKYKDKEGYQQWNGLISFGSGGVEGLGLGNGRQKFLFLPEAHTDFIFPTIGEELGLFTLVIVFCYVIMIICGIAISLNARDRFGMLMGVGVSLMLALQAAINIGVTTALMPNKGIPLPFISHGGTNLVFCMLCVGILLNIYRKGESGKTVRAATRPRPIMTPRI